MTSNIKDRRVNMASRARTRLTLDEVLSGVFDDNFGLSDSECSEEEREDIYDYSEKHLDRRERW